MDCFLYVSFCLLVSDQFMNRSRTSQGHTWDECPLLTLSAAVVRTQMASLHLSPFHISQVSPSSSPLFNRLSSARFRQGERINVSVLVVSCLFAIKKFRTNLKLKPTWKGEWKECLDLKNQSELPDSDQTQTWRSWNVFLPSGQVCDDQHCSERTGQRSQQMVRTKMLSLPYEASGSLSPKWNLTISALLNQQHSTHVHWASLTLIFFLHCPPIPRVHPLLKIVPIKYNVETKWTHWAGTEPTFTSLYVVTGGRGAHVLSVEEELQGMSEFH